MGGPHRTKSEFYFVEQMNNTSRNDKKEKKQMNTISK